MELDGIEAVVLMTASAFGVAVNTITGGGSLITLPVLLAVGIPLKHSLAINMVALSVGGIGSVFGGIKSLKKNPPKNFLVLLPTVIGATLGSMLLVVIPLEFLKIVIPVLILISTISLFLSQDNRKTKNTFLSTVFILVVSTYGGFFGAGMGVMLVSVLTFFDYGEIHIVTALKNLQQVFINAISAIILLSSGLILLKPAFLLMLGGLVGGYVTAKYLEYISAQTLKGLMIIIGLTLSIIFTAKLLIT